MEVDLDPALPALTGDPGRLQQVVWNLLSNAVKFTPPGGTVTVQAGAGWRRTCCLDGRRHGRGHRPRLPAPRVRALPPGGRLHHARPRRPRASGWPSCATWSSCTAARCEARERGPRPGRDVPRARCRRAAPRAAAAAGGLRDPQVAERCPAPLLACAWTACACSWWTTTWTRWPCWRPSSARAARRPSPPTRRRPRSPRSWRRSPDVLVSDIGLPGEDGFSLIAAIRGLPATRRAASPPSRSPPMRGAKTATSALRAGFDLHLAKPVSPDALVAAIADVRRARERSAGG